MDQKNCEKIFEKNQHLFSQLAHTAKEKEEGQQLINFDEDDNTSSSITPSAEG